MVRLVSLLERFFHQLGVLSGFLTLLVMMLVVVDVACRFLLNAPIPGAEEVAILLLVAKIYISMPTAQQEGQNFEVDIVTRLLPSRTLRVVRSITLAVSVIVVGLIAWLTVGLAWESVLENELTSGTVAFPVWPSRILIAFGLVCLTVQFLIDLLRKIGVLADRPDAQGGGKY
jgi:TRAP-type C4-dicarboxylate transport system permease small subunit